jgi:hypothetical protein
MWPALVNTRSIHETYHNQRLSVSQENLCSMETVMKAYVILTNKREGNIKTDLRSGVGLVRG